MTQTPPPAPNRIREPILRAPPIIVASIGVLAGIHLATLFMSDAAREGLIETYGLVPAHVQAALGTLGFNSETFWALVPFVSYAFLHGNFTHLIVNGLAFLIFATVVARRVGTMRFLAIGLVTNIAAAIAHLATNWGDPVAVIGASGAIAGYMGAATRFVFYDPQHPPSGPHHVLPLVSRPVVTFAVVWTLINVTVGVTGFSPDGSGDLTAWQAHLGGFFAGLLLFPLFDARRSWLR